MPVFSERLFYLSTQAFCLVSEYVLEEGGLLNFHTLHSDVLNLM